MGMTEQEIMENYADRQQQDCAYYIGLTGNLDKIASECTEAFGAAAGRLGITLDGLTPQHRRSFASLRSLLTEMLRHIRQGTGAELSVEGEEIPQFFDADLTFRHVLGGTAPRAAGVIGEAGHRPTVHLPNIDMHIAGLLESQNWLIAVGDDLFPADRAGMYAPGGYRSAANCIIQYAAGDTIPLARGAVTAPRDNRIIIAPTHKPERRLPLSQKFFESCIKEQGEAKLLLSGYNAMRDIGLLQKRITETRAYLADAPRSLTVLLEAAGYHDPAAFALVMRELGPAADFVSMNHEELENLRQLVFGTSDSLTLDALIPAASETAEALNFRNLVIHSDRVSFCLSSRESGHERISAALTAANTAAGAAAFQGGRSTEGLLKTGCTFPFHPQGADFASRYDGTACGSRTVSAAPARQLSGPVSTVGLGDAFIGTFMLFL